MSLSLLKLPCRGGYVGNSEMPLKVQSALATADCNDNFESIAGFEQRLCIAAARNDVAVALDGDLFSGKRQFIDQGGEVRPLREAA